MQEQVNLELMEFVEKSILPRYNKFGQSHGIEHVTRVIRNSLTLARQVGANIDMSYVIAAYHDLGMDGPRAIHHITSGKILHSDARLKKWFSNDQILIMKAAVEDHRASCSHSPRSIYGKIVAEADRDLEPEIVFKRAILCGIEHNPTQTKEQHWERFKKHIEEKYSINGYIHLWIRHSKNEHNLTKIREIITNTNTLRTEFDKIYNKEFGV